MAPSGRVTTSVAFDGRLLRGADPRGEYTLFLLPHEDGGIPSGALRISWGRAEYSTDWRMLWP